MLQVDLAASVLLQDQPVSHNHRATARASGGGMIDYLIVEGLILLIFLVAPIVALGWSYRPRRSRGRQREEQLAGAAPDLQSRRLGQGRALP
jgi:hypothetical protein